MSDAVQSPSTAAASAPHADASWHTPNTAKAVHALHLFASLKSNLTSTGQAPSGTSARRGSAPGATAGISRPHPRSVDHSLDREERRGRRSPSSVSATTTPTHPASSPSPPTYTEAELAAMSPVQLRRQLRLASAVSQRLHRRTQQLQRELSESQSRDHGGGASAAATDRAAAAAAAAAERRVAELSEQVRGLTERQHTLSHELTTSEGKVRQLQAALKDAQRAVALPTAATVPSPSSPPPPAPPSVQGAETAPAVVTDHAAELTLQRDTVRRLEHRLEHSEARLREATQLQIDALLRPRSSNGAPPQAPAVALVNAEVQRLFQLMQAQLVDSTVQQQAERARMNELFYQLERQRGLK